MKPSLNHPINFILLISLSLILVEALTDESSKITSALKGRTYFAPRQSVTASTSATISSSSVMAPRKSVRVVRPLKYIESENVSESESQSESDSESESESEIASVSESDTEINSVSASENESRNYSETFDSTSSARSDDSISSCSSSNSIAEGPICRLSRRSSCSPLSRIDYQRPWCPGQVMASLVTRAFDPVYDWKNPLTCAQFASNFGGVSVIVGELDGPTFCTAGLNQVSSPYTITRSLSINQPIYARALSNEVEFAVAAGPIFYPQGLVLYISVAKEVSKLPQICN